MRYLVNSSCSRSVTHAFLLFVSILLFLFLLFLLFLPVLLQLCRAFTFEYSLWCFLDRKFLPEASLGKTRRNEANLVRGLRQGTRTLMPGDFFAISSLSLRFAFMQSGEREKKMRISLYSGKSHVVSPVFSFQ
jgi:hypothetical protein